MVQGQRWVRSEKTTPNGQTHPLYRLAGLDPVPTVGRGTSGAPDSTNHLQPTGNPPSLSSCRGHPVPMGHGTERGNTTTPVVPDPDRGPPSKTPSPVGEGWGEGQTTTPFLDLPDLIRYPRWGAGRAGHTLPPTTSNRQVTHARHRLTGDTRYPRRQRISDLHLRQTCPGPAARIVPLRLVLLMYDGPP